VEGFALDEAGDGQMRVRAVMLVALVVLLAACDWTMSGYDAGNTGFNPSEPELGVGDVGALTQSWASMPKNVTNPARPAVAGGVVYLGRSDGVLSALREGGCGGLCQPLWTASTGSGIVTSPVVADGIVYVASFDAIRAFAVRADFPNCGGSPVLQCAPVWTASVAGRSPSSPVVVHGILYAVFSGQLEAFDARGQVGCSGTPKTCQPLWGAAVLPTGASIGAPTVADGKVYVSLDGGRPSPPNSAMVAVYDAAGVDHCAGAPKTCSPVRALLPTCSFQTLIGCDLSYPVVSGGKVFVASAAYDATGGTEYSLHAFDAAGVMNCASGQRAPVDCTPIWGGSGLHGNQPPAVAGQTVFAQGGVLAFDAAGATGCAGAPHVNPDYPVCTPRQLSPALGMYALPAVADGVVYSGSTDLDLSKPDTLYMWNAAGSCTGICPPISTIALPHGTFTNGIDSRSNLNGPVVANGAVYVATRDGLRVFRAP
jgi:outer membrane protein assembly factor BamB